MGGWVERVYTQKVILATTFVVHCRVVLQVLDTRRGLYHADITCFCYNLQCVLYIHSKRCSYAKKSVDWRRG